MKIEEVLKQAAACTEHDTCDPCQQGYADGLREGGQLPLTPLMKRMKDLHEQAAELGFESTATAPRSQHSFLPMVCCARPDNHLGAVED